MQAVLRGRGVAAPLGGRVHVPFRYSPNVCSPNPGDVQEPRLHVLKRVGKVLLMYVV